MTILEKIINFIKSHGYETVLALLMGGGGLWLLSLLAQAVDMGITYPLPLAACIFLSFLFGLLVSFLTGVKERRQRVLEEELHRENSERLEKARSKSEKILREHDRAANEAEMINRVKRLDFEDKVWIYTVYSQRSFDAKEHPYSYDVFPDLSHLDEDYLEGECTYEGTRWTMSPSIRMFFHNHSDLFNDVIEFMDLPENKIARDLLDVWRYANENRELEF